MPPQQTPFECGSMRVHMGARRQSCFTRLRSRDADPHRQKGRGLTSSSSTMTHSVSLSCGFASTRCAGFAEDALYTRRGDELGALTHDFRENRFAISVDRCHLDQINDASPRVSCAVRFSQTRPEFIRPLPDQLTLQKTTAVHRANLLSRSSA